MEEDYYYCEFKVEVSDWKRHHTWRQPDVNMEKQSWKAAWQKIKPEDDKSAS
jgi:hypothetical protein